MTTITPPGPPERIMRGIGYLANAVAGIWVMLVAPATLQISLGIALAIIWGCFMLAAIPAALAAFLGRYRIEYVCLPFLSWGLFVAAATATVHSYFEPDVFPRACFLIALFLSNMTRMVTLHRLVSVKGAGWTSSR